MLNALDRIAEETPNRSHEMHACTFPCGVRGLPRSQQLGVVELQYEDETRAAGRISFFQTRLYENEYYETGMKVELQYQVPGTWMFLGSTVQVEVSSAITHKNCS